MLPHESPPLVFVLEPNLKDAVELSHAFHSSQINAALRIVRNEREFRSYLMGAGVYEDRRTHPLPRILVLAVDSYADLGAELLRWLEQKVFLTPLPVLVYGSKQSSEDIQKIYKLGAQTYLAKPFPPRALAALMQELGVSIKPPTSAEPDT